LGEPITNPIDHVQKNFDLLEFTAIEKKSSVNPASCDEAFKEYNKPKNRYTFVVPYDTTRVKLAPLENEEGSDYINASWVHNQNYIATQGPLPITFFDFWRMVWQYNIKVIVMLTKTFENGRMKCHRYWPESTQTETYNDFKVISSSEEEDEETATTVRKFKIVHVKTEEEREVIHYQYHGWPDHGVPSNTEEIRHLLRRMEEVNTDAKAPVAVHCSAGIGRTGTLCTIHLTLNKIKDHVQKNGATPFPFDVYSTVMQLRAERSGMVQQPEQYRFCYQSILEGAKEFGLQLPGLESLSPALIDGRESVESDIPPDQRKKKKKKKKSTDESSPDPNGLDESGASPPNGEEHHKKKKKKKKVSNGSTDPASDGHEKKKRKKKKKPVDNTNEEKTEIPNDHPVLNHPDSPPSISNMQREKQTEKKPEEEKV